MGINLQDYLNKVNKHLETEQKMIGIWKEEAGENKQDYKLY